MERSDCARRSLHGYIFGHGFNSRRLHHAADEANTQFVPVSGYFHVIFLQFVPISHQIVVNGQLLKAKKRRKSRYVL